CMQVLESPPFTF
nr:immunoglobulin light chain junction region [Macaca mulatta]